MNSQLRLIVANTNPDTLSRNNLANILSATSIPFPTQSALAITSKSSSKKTNNTAPTEGAKRGRQPLPRDDHGKIIRKTIDANSEK